MEHAYDKQDGVAFQFIIREINQKLRSIKKSSKGNQLATVTEGWNGMPVELVVHIYEETYQRSAGPRVKELLKYQAFSSTTYGELNSG
jgi:H3 lysine-79-specific histone-lysine N-methyltransferase